MTAILGILVIRSSLIDWWSMKKECRHARHNKNCTVYMYTACWLGGVKVGIRHCKMYIRSHLHAHQPGCSSQREPGKGDTQAKTGNGRYETIEGYVRGVSGLQRDQKIITREKSKLEMID